jgi:hypothetical protein
MQTLCGQNDARDAQEGPYNIYPAVLSVKYIGGKGLHYACFLSGAHLKSIYTFLADEGTWKVFIILIHRHLVGGFKGE